jgi:hypothetical protein
MKTSQLIPGKKIVTMTCPQKVGVIESYTTLSGKSSLVQKNVFVRIRTLSNHIIFATADMIIDYTPL